MEQEIRVRFAPSPTGGLHIGGLKTALFNYLFAKHHNGKMILRIEDTDQSRYVDSAEQYIKNALKWCRIELDEGPDQGGEYGPYRQSERKEIYAQYAQQLLDDGKAYYAFDTSEELGEMREKLKDANVANATYNAITRDRMRNSFTLSEEEVAQLLENGTPHVIRLNVPKKDEIRLNDAVHGWIKVLSSTIDDKIIMKSDGMPTYHLANIVDDHLMKITHVIRGDEWLPSAPLHVLLYKYLGWEESMPTFAHLPLILKPEGHGKLSKRDSDKHGFPIFPLTWSDPTTGEDSIGFKETGYLPEALINFLALLGWNPGTDEELFSLQELTERFTLERVGKSGTKFDIQKAQWFNQQYLKSLSDEAIIKLITPVYNKHDPDNTLSLASIISLMKERVVYPEEIVTNAIFLFEKPTHYDEKTVNKKWTQEAVDVIGDFRNQLSTLESFEAEKVKSIFQTVIENNNTGFGKVMPAVRIALTGMGSGPDLMAIMELIGKKETLDRFDLAIQLLSDRIKIRNG